MCGIAGFNWADDRLLKKCLKKLEHRGPDSSGTYTDKGISIGMKRLKIIDLSKNADQPMTDEKGRYWLVFNGEIYNFKELRKKLSKHRFKSESDTEVVIHLYEEYGPQCVEFLDGMFAFAIWDSEKKTLFLARDRLGIKPLYYYHKNNKFIFASEIKAFIDEIPKKMNSDVARNYFDMRYTTGEDTFFEDVKKLLPGHYMIVKNGKTSINKYWDVKCCKKKSIDFNATEKEIERELSDSVKKTLVSDVPVGIFLSGGLDSSAITAYTRKFNPYGKIMTFCADFGNCKENESNYAQQVADHFGTDHTNVFVDKLRPEIFSKISYHLDEPLADSANIPVYMISEIAKKKVKVMLSGDGSDELFLGYERHKTFKNMDMMRNLFNPLKNKIRFPEKIMNNSHRLRTFNNNMMNSPLDIVWASRKKKFNMESNITLSQLCPRKNPYSVYEKNISNKTLLDSIYYVDMKEWLPNDILQKTDRMTMAHSIEARVPFLNRNLIELSSNIPNECKLRFGIYKYLLKKSMKNIVPDTIIKREKQGLSIPLKKWLNEGLKEYSIDLITENNSGYFTKEYYDKIKKDISDSSINHEIFWKIMFFEEWHRKNFNN